MTTTPPPHPAAAAAAAHPAAPWHVAGCLVSLKAGVDAHWPGRDKRSDGGIGDARHQAEGSASDHNPWLKSKKGPAVRAYDFTVSQPGIAGVDGPWLAECLRLAGAAGDNRLAGRSGDTSDNGYVIFDRHITAPDFSRWVPYDGPDDHTTHVHVSATRDPDGFEDDRSWSFLVQKPDHPIPPAVTPTGHDATGHGDGFRAGIGDAGPEVYSMERALHDFAPAYAGGLHVDGVYDQETAAAVAEFAHREAHDPATPPPAGDVAGLESADGLNVGPRLAAAFHRDGLQL